MSKLLSIINLVGLKTALYGSRLWNLRLELVLFYALVHTPARSRAHGAERRHQPLRRGV